MPLGYHRRGGDVPDWHAERKDVSAVLVASGSRVRRGLARLRRQRREPTSRPGSPTTGGPTSRVRTTPRAIIARS